MSRYPLALPSWDERELTAIRRVVESGRFTMGDEVRQFEKKFAEFVGSRYAIMVNSGSSANLVAVASFCYRERSGLRPGDEVIVPAVSWPTTFYPLSQHGLIPIFVDINLNSLNIDLDTMATALGPKVKAVMVPNLLGNPAPLEEIRSFCNEHGLLMIEDNCESLGAEIHGKQAGTFGDAGTFSFFFSHHMSTMEGGMVVTDDAETFQRAVSLRAHGWTRDLPEPNVLALPTSDSFQESYRFVLPGYNVRPLEVSGAIGCAQLEKLPEMIRTRRQNASQFVGEFTGDPDFMIQREHGASSWFGFSLILRPESKLMRQHVVAALSQAKIESRPIVAGNFLRQPVASYIPHRLVGKTDAADRVHDHGLFVGNHPIPIADELDHLRDTLRALPGRRE